MTCGTSTRTDVAATGKEGSAGGTPPAVSVRSRWVEWRDRHDRPVYSVTLWPHRSLTPGVKKIVFAVIGAGIVLPLIGLIGTLVFWGMLPFLLLPAVLLWLSLRRSDRDGALTELVEIWRDEMRVVRREPGGAELRWQADPRRVRLRLSDGPVESYLTIKGGGREIELGRFLSPEERRALATELEEALTRAIRA